MACNCIDNLTKALEKEHGEDFYFKNLDQTINTSNGELGWSIPMIRIAVPKTLKGGKKSKSQYREALIGYNFCPICGTPYKEGVSRTPNAEQWLTDDDIMEMTIRAVPPDTANPKFKFVASMDGYGHLGSEDGIAGRGATIDEALKALEQGVPKRE